MSTINTVLTPSLKEILNLEHGDFLTTDLYRFWRFHFGSTVVWCDITKKDYVVKIIGRLETEWYGKPTIIASALNQPDLLDRFIEICYKVLMPYTFNILEGEE